MILISIMLGGLVLSATAIAGLLMFLTLQQSSDALSSGAAFFAADAGVEQGLYCYFYKADPSVCGTQSQPIAFSLDNGATGSYWVFRNAGTITVTGTGNAGKTERILQTNIITQ